MAHRLSLAHIEEASSAIDPVFLKTPQFVAESLSAALGVRLVVKVETVNPVRSFKGRGAEYLVSKMARGPEIGTAEIMTASAGNFGQAMAYACRKRGVGLVVYASLNANPLKIERMRALGAEVVLHGKDFDEAKAEAKRVAARARRAHGRGQPRRRDGRRRRHDRRRARRLSRAARCRHHRHRQRRARLRRRALAQVRRGRRRR